MQSDEVLTLLRDARPGSVETPRQERFIRAYASLLWSRKADAPDIPELVRAVSLARSEREEEELVKAECFPDPEGTHSEAAGVGCAKNQSAKAKREAKELDRVKKDVAKRAPKYVVCVGLPGSGKSTFSRALESSGAWARANQDDLGRKGCEQRVSEMVPQVRQGRTRLVLDRCNTSKEERKEWLDMLGKPPAKDVVCVFFDTPAESCKQRAAARLDHPTIRAGGGGRIIDDIAKRLERPSPAEGFATVEAVNSAEDAAALLRRFGVDPEPVLAAARAAPGANVIVKEVAEENAVQDAPEDELEQQSALPEAFLAWLREALLKEVDEADAEGLGAAVEVILAEPGPEAEDSAVQVLQDGGAPDTAASLRQEWQAAAATVPSRG